MIIYVTIIIITIVLIISIFYLVSKKDSYRKTRISETVDWLYECINNICYHSKININYKILETDKLSYVDNNIIYLVIWNEKHDRIYNENTLLFSCLTKIQQIIKDTNQIDIFDIAKKLGYYDSDIPIESDYVTIIF